MARWLYRVVAVSTERPKYKEMVPFWNDPDVDEILQHTFSHLGKQGWELVGFLPANYTSGHYAVFKMEDGPGEYQEQTVDQARISKSVRRNIAKQGRKT